MEEAGSIREEILRQMPPEVRARTAACLRKEKAFQIAAADYYMRRMAEEEGLGKAETIRVGHEQDGRPFLLSGVGRIGKNIAISHSDAYIFMCMAEAPVGCDVEKIRRFPVNDGLKGFFSKADLSAIRVSERPEILLTRIWTRREAFAKLSGNMEGLSRWSFHDKEAARREYGVLFTESQEDGYLFTAAQFESAEDGQTAETGQAPEAQHTGRGEGTD